MAGRLRRKIHVSWLVAWFSGALIGGIALSAALHGTFAATAWLLAAVAFLFIAAAKRTVAMVVLVIAAGLLSGLWRGGVEQLAIKQYTPLLSSYVQLQGTVSEDTTYGPHGDQRLTLSSVVVSGQQLHGRVWASTSSRADVRRSDVVMVRGKLARGFGSLPASMPRAQVVRITRPQPGDIGLQLRDWFAAGVRRAVPEPQASLGNGFLTGQHSTLPQDLDNQMKVAGLTHVVVASGYNLTILVGLARRLLARVSKYLALLSAGGMITGFMAITGLSPSMSRAGLVAGLSLAAWYYGRKIHPLVLLPFAAAITAVINPEYIWGDVGWYLSFTSFIGVIVLAPLVNRCFWGAARPGVLRQIIVDTMSAQLATLPIIIFTFGHYSAYALLANLLVLPLVPLTMLLTFAAGIAGCFVPGIAHIAGLPAALVLRYMTSVVGWIASWPGAQNDLHITAVILTASYAALILAVIFLWRKTHYDFRSSDASAARKF
jgi:competence protein ComEC